jgi:tetratricopeptide (TPR) repeat protein
MEMKLLSIALLSALLIGCTASNLSHKNSTTILEEGKIYCSSENPKAIKFYRAGYTAAQKEDFTKAKLNYQKAIDTDPLYCDAMDNLGLIYRSEGKITEAIQLYSKSLQISPSNEIALINLAVAYKFNKQPDKAIELYERLIDINPSNPEGCYGMGNTLASQLKFEEAVPYLLKADQIYIDSNSKYLHHSGYLLGKSYFKQGKCSESIYFIERSYDQFRSDPEVNYYLGICHLTEPFYSITKARSYLEQAEKSGAIIPESIKTASLSEKPVYINFKK